MSIDTQILRHAATSVRAFLKPEYGREISLAADHIDAQAAEIKRLRAALILAEGAMNYMGDILNGMDAVEPEDEQATEPAFLAVHAALSGEPT